MKTTFLKITSASFILILALLMQANPVNAQQDKNKDGQHGANREKMEAQRVAFITQKLDLTPDEAKVFWPVYNEYDSKRHDLMKSFRGSGDYHRDDLDKLTETEATQILDNQIIEAQTFLDLRKEYHAKFKSVLPAVKILKLYDAERQFQKMLMEKMHNNSPKPPSDKK
jgi:hypothetical protein